MHTKHSLFYSTTAKTSMGSILAIVIVAGFGYYLYSTGALDNLLAGFSIAGQGGNDPGNLVDVNKKIQFTWSDEWSGTVANAKTFYIYDDSFALKETLTTAATGIVASAQNYPSGTNLYVKFVDGNDKVMYEFTVPKMNPSDAEANTYNDIAFKDFEIGTYTGDTCKTGAYTIADAGAWNVTGNTTTPVFIYTLANSGADNTGLIESYDYVYSQAWQVWITGTINSSNIIINGADYVFNVGTTQYFAKKIDATALSLWKVGNSYVPGYEGSASCSWSLDTSGYSDTTAVMQITAYAYADPSYAQTHGGNYGAGKVEIAEQTISITV